MGLTRRTLLQSASLATAAAQTAASGPPNLVFLISDDHSFAHLGSYGDPHVRTPNLDRMASQGMRFTQAFVTSPQCSPNRSAILTGQSPHTTGTSRLHTPMPPWQPSLLEPLKQRGYFTGAYRKVHQGSDFDGRFDFRAEPNAPFSAFFDRLPQGRPFFLHVGFTDPHRPYKPGAVTPPHDPAKVTVPEWLPDTPEVRQDLVHYYDFIARMDADAGQVLAELERRGLAGNTLVIFTGDNGMPFPPRGKGTLYEYGIRVPLLARWPGRVKAGSVSNDLVSHVDLPVTWLDAAGVRKPESMQGQSFLPALEGKGYTARREVFSERNWHDNFDLQRCIRTARHKLIYNGIPVRPFRPIADLEQSPTWASYTAAAKAGTLSEKHRTALTPTRPLLELYDLEADPHERTDLAEKPEHAALKAGLLARLGTWMDGTYDFLPPPFREFPARSGKQRPTL